MLNLVVGAITQAFAHGAFISTFSSYLEFNPEFKISIKVSPVRETDPEFAFNSCLPVEGTYLRRN